MSPADQIMISDHDLIKLRMQTCSFVSGCFCFIFFCKSTQTFFSLLIISIDVTSDVSLTNFMQKTYPSYPFPRSVSVQFKNVLKAQLQ